MKKFINLKKLIELTKKSFANTLFFVVTRVKIEIVDFITLTQMNVKQHHDRKYQSLYIKLNDYILIRLHREYNISSTIVLKVKYNQ